LNFTEKLPFRLIWSCLFLGHFSSFPAGHVCSLFISGFFPRDGFSGFSASSEALLEFPSLTGYLLPHVKDSSLPSGTTLSVRFYRGHTRIFIRSLFIST
jgi:hypothetical protein